MLYASLNIKQIYIICDSLYTTMYTLILMTTHSLSCSQLPTQFLFCNEYEQATREHEHINSSTTFDHNLSSIFKEHDKNNIHIKIEF